MRDSRRNSRHRQVVAAVVGNTLEWYDFIVYGFFRDHRAAILSRREPVRVAADVARDLRRRFLHAPGGRHPAQLYADRSSRKAAMQLIIFLMTLSIALITFAPSYAVITGGAHPDRRRAVAAGFRDGRRIRERDRVFVESAPENRRGLYGSWQPIGQCLAVFRRRDGRVGHAIAVGRGAA